MASILMISDFPDAQYQKDSGTPALRLIVEALSKRHKVFLISPSTEGEGYPTISQQFHVPPLSDFKYLPRKAYPLIFNNNAYRIAMDILCHEEINLVYGAGCLSVTAAGDITTARGIPSIGRLFGTYLLPYLHNPLSLAIKYEEVAAFASACTKFIITNDGTGGNEVAKYFRIPPENLYFWMNGVDTPPEVPPRSDRQIRIISMARLEKWKRVDRIIRSFVPLPYFFDDNIHLDIVGDGPERENLKKLAFGSPNIHFHGELPRKQALEMLASTDIFITTNDYSNVSNSLLEAMAAGKTIIALDTGMTGGIIHDGENGILVRDENLLTSALYRAIEDSITREMLGNHAKEFADRHFMTWDQRITREVLVCEETMR